MRTSQYLLSTERETPSDAVVTSHQLMLRAGMIRKLASGLYTWLPTGLRVLRKVEKIVREEMNKSGALEVSMPVVQPAELWHESTRWEQYGPELLRITDRHSNSFCLGPTHEEVITDLIRNEVHSYKQLPMNFYQIQTKFRDEIRPRFGIMRAREFLMKDAYSFHIDETSLQETYEVMHATYCSIFDRLGLDYRPVIADTGSIGGSASHEFHVLADSGEDDIAFSDSSDYAANVEMAEALAPDTPRGDATATLEKIATPDQKTIEEVCEFLKVDAASTVKTLVVEGDDEHPLVALVVRGDHTLNEIKAEKIHGVKSPLTLAADEAIKNATGALPGSIGPAGLDMPLMVDRSAAHASNFVCGANEDGFHYTGANWDRDCTATAVVDIRNIENGDPSPDGKGTVSIKRGIEVGHIFQLGTKYSEAMDAKVLGENGKTVVMPMGCYGIGVSRVVAAAIEQNNDDNGIIWPTAIAPFQIALMGVNPKKSSWEKETCNKLYDELTEAGIEVIYDDRIKERLGVKLSDMELIGIPFRVVVGEKGLTEGTVEFRARTESENQHVAVQDIVRVVKEALK